MKDTLGAIGLLLAAIGGIIIVVLIGLLILAAVAFGIIWFIDWLFFPGLIDLIHTMISNVGQPSIET